MAKALPLPPPSTRSCQRIVARTLIEITQATATIVRLSAACMCTAHRFHFWVSAPFQFRVYSMDIVHTDVYAAAPPSSASRRRETTRARSLCVMLGERVEGTS